MAILLETQLAASVLNSGFAEEISYTPSGGTEKTIKAIVEREDPNPSINEGGREFPVDGVRFTIQNDAVKGTDIVTKTLDKVALPVRVGQSNSTLVVSKILYHDSGIFYLEAKK